MSGCRLQLGLLLCLVGLAELATAELSDSRILPPRMSISNLPSLDCRASRGTNLESEVRFDVWLVVSRKGKAERISPAKDSPGWVKDIAECALHAATFEPATQVGNAFEQLAYVTMTFAGTGDLPGAPVRVTAMGPLVTGPVMYQKPGDPMHCYPVGADIKGEGARILVTVSLDAGGLPTSYALPSGSAPWAHAAITCMMGRLAFYPATRGGIPFESPVKIPFVFPGPGERVPTPMKVVQPTLASGDAELAKARQECARDKQVRGGSVYLAFTIGASGEALAPLILKGLDEPQADAAAICILQRLRFTPIQFGSRRHDAVVSWVLDLEPSSSGAHKPTT